MTPTNVAAANPVAFFTGAILGAAIVGLVVGLIPLAVGALTGQKHFGTTGFIFCLIGSLVGGAVVAIPIAVAFCVYIVIKSRKASKQNEAAPPPAP